MAPNTSTYFRYDRTDREILSSLQADAWRPQGEIARAVGLSEGATSLRVAKLSRSGAIRRVTAVLDDRRMGCDITAFVEVFVEPARFERPFIAAMEKDPEVQEVHHITGEFSLLLKVKTRNRDTLQRLLLTRVTGHPGVRRTRTVVALSTPKEETALPLAVLRDEREEKR